MAIQQFNFQKHWQQIISLLDTEEVQIALQNFWLHIQSEGYVHDHIPDPSLPVYYGKEPIGGWNTSLTKEDLDAYRPRGCCHAIASFSKTIGTLLFPELTWGLITGQFHSVAVGCTDEDSEPDYKIFLNDNSCLTPHIVMDILLSDKNGACFSAEESLAYALLDKMVDTPSIDEYENKMPGGNPWKDKTGLSGISKHPSLNGTYFQYYKEAMTKVIMEAWRQEEFKVNLL